MGGNTWLAGSDISLADLHAAPMIAYAMTAPEGRALMQSRRRLSAWWQCLEQRPSIAATISVEP